MKVRPLAHPFLGLLLVVTVVSVGSVRPTDPSALEGNAILVTQAPPGSAAALLSHRYAPVDRYPAGSRIVLLPRPGSSGDEVVISGGLRAAGAPAVSDDGEWAAFTGKATPEEPWAIYVTRLSGGSPRRVVTMLRDCVDPAWLPGARLVFACRDAAPATTAGGDRCALPAGWSLVTASLGEGAPQRITFGPGAALDPTVLEDGRILFSMTMEPGPGRPSCATALFTVNPDGTLVEPFAGAHAPPLLKLRPRSTFDGGIVYLGSEGERTGTAALRLELNRPFAPPAPIAGGATAVAALADVTSAEPLAGGGLLVAARALRESDMRDPPAPGIHRVDGGGVEVLFETAKWDAIEAVPAVRRPRPRSIPAVVDETQDRAVLICYDSARTDGTVGPPRDAERPVTLVVQTSPETAGEGTRGVGDSQDPERTRAMDILTRPLETDASFMVELPSDRPLRVRTLGSTGATIATSGWFWMRPGEVRACFGCHEPRQDAPVNHPVEALRSPLPVDLPTGGGR